MKNFVMPRRALLALLAPLLLASCGSGSDLRPLTVVGWGGSSQDAHRQAYWSAFSRTTGIPLREDSWRGGVGVIRTKVMGGDTSWDIVQVETEDRSEEHTSELQSLMRISYAVFCLTKKKKQIKGRSH